MNIYGYESDESELVSLKEITLQLTVSELDDLISFMQKTMLLMQKHEDYGHEHYKDFKQDVTSNMPDIIITKSNS